MKASQTCNCIMECTAVCLILSLLSKHVNKRIIKILLVMLQLCNDKIQHPKSAPTDVA